MNRLIAAAALAFALSGSWVVAQEPIQKTSVTTVWSNNVDPIIKDLQWNRWTSESFTVLCLDDKQAQFLHQHLELIKEWSYERWGLADIPFAAECKVVCVHDRELFTKLFGIEESKVEIRRDATGKIESTVMFLLIDKLPAECVPGPLMEVCMGEFGQHYNSKPPLWASRGMGSLNRSIEQIRTQLATLEQDLRSSEPIFFSEGLLTMTEENYRKLSAPQREQYDRIATAFCLLLRKEYGQDKFLWFLKKTSEGEAPVESLKTLLAFDGYATFDKTLKQYMIDISGDCKSGETPANYLQIRAKN